MDESVQKQFTEMDGPGRCLLAVAAAIEERGWCQGYFEDAHGRLCIIGAFQYVARNGGSYYVGALSRFIAAVGGSSILFNDAQGRTQAEVVAKLREVALRGP